MGFSEPAKLLEHARMEAREGERFFEFRLDYLSHVEQGIRVIAQILEELPDTTILATCRRHQNHGRFNGSIEQQIQVLSDAVDAGARAVDLEIESAEIANSRVDALRGKTFTIVSYHNYDGTPSMDSILKRMLRVSADAYKLVATARKPSDIQRILAASKSHPKIPMVLLAMGEQGMPSRVLSAAIGGLFTYAAPMSAEGTAVGQMNAKVLRNLYRIEKFTRAAKIYGVIADPVRHSISPAVHNRAFQSKRLDAVYLPFLVHPPQLKDFLVLAERLPLAGFSVTIPHKQKIMRYLDAIEPLARRIGAVNTVWRKGGKWRGTNTDAAGVIGPLGKRVRLAKAHVLVVGNGGAARGAAFALGDAGTKVSLTGRNIDRVRALAKACNAEPLTREQALAMHFDALVHATPLGMFPHVSECFFEDALPADTVFDMVYNPIETVLVQKARQQKKEVIAGIDMFLEQAAAQFEIWTGDSAPRAAMERAALDALSHNGH